MAIDDYAKGLVFGTLIGAAIGILCAPRSGMETRSSLCRSTEESLEKAREQFRRVREGVEKLVGCEKELYAEKKERLKRAVEAGIEAFKQEKPEASASSNVP